VPRHLRPLVRARVHAHVIVRALYVPHECAHVPRVPHALVSVLRVRACSLVRAGVVALLIYRLTNKIHSKWRINMVPILIH
jgi:transcription initiation factor TFIIIB Brf1 subunit/transcription initiation factor TFIIB